MKGKIIALSALALMGLLAGGVSAQGQAPATNYTFYLMSETRNYTGTCTGTVWQMWDVANRFYFPATPYGVDRFNNATSSCGALTVNFDSAVASQNDARYWFKTEGHLGKAGAWNYVQGGSFTAPALKAGDCYENSFGISNNLVDIEDFTALQQAYGTSFGQAGYKRACDFNADGTVEVLDYGALHSNFGTSGDAPICYIAPCLEPKR